MHSVSFLNRDMTYFGAQHGHVSICASPSWTDSEETVELKERERERERELHQGQWFPFHAVHVTWRIGLIAQLFMQTASKKKKKKRKEKTPPRFLVEFSENRIKQLERGGWGEETYSQYSTSHLAWPWSHTGIVLHHICTVCGGWLTQLILACYVLYYMTHCTIASHQWYDKTLAFCLCDLFHNDVSFYNSAKAWKHFGRIELMLKWRIATEVTCRTSTTALPSKSQTKR